MDPKIVPNSFFTHSFLEFKVSYVQFLLLHTQCAAIVDFQKVAITTGFFLQLLTEGMFLHNVYKIIKYTFKLINVTLQNMYKAIVSQRGLLFEHNNHPKVPKKSFSTCKGFSPHDLLCLPLYINILGVLGISTLQVGIIQNLHSRKRVEKFSYKTGPFELMYIYCMRILLKIWTQFINFLHGFPSCDSPISNITSH